jgi:hypothetical protein
LLYGVLVVWFWEQSSAGLQAVIPNRPWYGHKEHVSFEDIVRTVRAALAPGRLLGHVVEVAPLRRAHRGGRARPATSLPRVA